MKSGRMHCVFDSRGERGRGKAGLMYRSDAFIFVVIVGRAGGERLVLGGQISPWAANHIPHPGLYPADILGHYGHEAMIGERVPFTPAPLIRGRNGAPRRIGASSENPSHLGALTRVRRRANASPSI